MRRTSTYWKFLHPPVKVFFFPAFVESLQIINKSSPEPSFAAIQTLLGFCIKSGYVFRPLHGTLL